MKLYQSLFAISLFAALTAAAGCGTSDVIDDDGKAISELQVTPETTALVKGSTMQLHATVKYADGTSKDVTKHDNTLWNTSNPNVAIVSKEGMVTAVLEGVVDITAKYKGEKATESLVVTP